MTVSQIICASDSYVLFLLKYNSKVLDVEDENMAWVNHMENTFERFCRWKILGKITFPCKIINFIYQNINSQFQTHS